MPYTLLQQKARTKYVTVKDIAEQYSLSIKQVYALLKRPEFQETIVRFGDKKAIRVNLDKFFEITQKIF